MIALGLLRSLLDVALPWWLAGGLMLAGYVCWRVLTCWWANHVTVSLRDQPRSRFASQPHEAIR